MAANPNTGAFFTRLADAKAAAASNTKAGVPVNVKFRAGKGYYLYQGGASKGASTPSGGGVQSYIQNYLAGLTKGPAVPAPPDFSSPAFSSAVDAGVNAQVQPQVDAIKQQQGHEKFLYDQETQNAKGYSEGLAKILTGGNTNDAGMQYSKDNFGGSYLGAIASQQGGQLLAKITQDFNNNDWQLASKLADAMAQVPAIRDKITSNLESQANDTYNQQYKSAQDDFNNRIQIAGLLINQQKTAFDQNRAVANDAFTHTRLLNNDAFTRQVKIAGLKQGDARIAISQQNADTSAARYNLSVTKMQWQQANADRSYGLSYDKFIASERRAEQKAKQAAKRGGLSVAGQNALAQKVQDFTKSIYQGVPNHITYPNSTNNLPAPRIDSWKQKALTYQQAIKTLVNRFPSLGASGAIAAANQLYQPGEGGRPLGKDALDTLHAAKAVIGGGPLDALTQPTSGAAVKLTAVPSAFSTAPGKLINGQFLPQVEGISRTFGVRLSSGYRSPSHNEAVGGASHSDHLSGNAADFVGSPAQISALYAWAIKQGFPYVEPMPQARDHVHISFAR